MKILGVGLDSALMRRLDALAPSSTFMAAGTGVIWSQQDVVIAKDDDPVAFLSALERQRRHGAPYLLWVARADELVTFVDITEHRAALAARPTVRSATRSSSSTRPERVERRYIPSRLL